MATLPGNQELIAQKLAAFERMEPEFEACFSFVEDVHGQKRFPSFSVADTVRYLHSLWICECKTGLLSVSKTVKEYEGKHCLELLRAWQQEGDTASVVAFLYHKLDMLPLAEITRQIEDVRQDDNLARRLMHGRSVMLNRGMNLMQALDDIFSLTHYELARTVGEACAQSGHLPDQIPLQLEDLDSPLYSYVPHQVLAQRNMVVMNKLGINSADKPEDLPGHRTWRVVTPTEPLQPYAEHVVQGYQELTSPSHNNVKGRRFVDRPEESDTGNV